MPSSLTETSAPVPNCQTVAIQSISWWIILAAYKSIDFIGLLTVQPPTVHHSLFSLD